MQDRYEELATVYPALLPPGEVSTQTAKKTIEALESFQRRLVYLMAYYLITCMESDEAIWAELRSLGAFNDEQRRFAPDPINTVAGLVIVVGFTFFHLLCSACPFWSIPLARRLHSTGSAASSLLTMRLHMRTGNKSNGLVFPLLCNGRCILS